MPKGKPKARNPALYKGDESEERGIRHFVPKAAPHRRGGTHRVKDSDRTNTHWDDKNYQELLIVTKDRGLWRKDMPKKEMAKVLAEKDKADRVAAKKAADEAIKQRKEMEEKMQKEKEEMEKRQREKEARRKLRDCRAALGEDVSSSSSDDAGPSDGNVGVGQILSDGNEDYESTTTTTTTPSSLAPISPALKLRIYEWQYERAPPSSPPLSPISPFGRACDEAATEPIPKKIPYAVMHVVTTKSREMFELPGRAIPAEVGPDFVPSLSEHTKDCARNGVLILSLRNAVIERGSEWTARTQIQWWNGRMYFQLPPRKSKTDLASVYAKWRRKKTTKSQERRKKGGGITKAEPKRKAQQRLQDQREKMIDVYAASEYRPSICYVPSNLDSPSLNDDEEVEKSLENLFYIRFRNMELPHYFFWANFEEWDDPTIPNPAWAETEPHEQVVLPIDRGDMITYQYPVHKAQVNVRRTPVPHKFSTFATPPKGSKYKVTLWAIERDLYHYGWANTMYVLRDKWLKEGKGGRWTRLISQLVREFPAGNLPTSPPVGPPRPNTTSLAEKLAAMEVPNPLRPVEPIEGHEHWTRDDSAYWVAVDAPDQKQEEEIQMELLRSGTPTEPQALHRRPSEVVAWVNDLGSLHSPPTALDQISLSSDTPANRTTEREAWEERFMQHVEGETVLVSTIDSMPVAELKSNLLNYMNERRRSSVSNDRGRCFVCLAPLDGLTFDERRAHYGMHAKSANELCPFCGLPWMCLTSELKAAHIFWHDVDEGQTRTGGRRSLGTSFGIGALAAIPKKKRAIARGREKTVEVGQRGLSKVHFSPVIATKRIADNDFEDEDYGMDKDVSSVVTACLRRSGLRSPTTPTKTPAKPALTFDISTNATRATRSSNRRSRKPDTNYQKPTNPSAYPSSSFGFNSAKRVGHLIDNDPDSAWNPGQQSSSSSEQITSPYLAKFATYPREYVDAKWDPKRISTFSSDSLEFYRRKKSLMKNIENGKEAQMGVLERRSSGPNVRGKGRKMGVDEDEYDYADETSNASSYDLAAIYTRRGPQDPSFRDAFPSPLSSPASQAAVSPKRKRAADSITPDQVSLSTPPKIVEQPTKRRKIKASKASITLAAIDELTSPGDVGGSNRNSTVSNASSASDLRRSSLVEFPKIDVVDKSMSKGKTPAALRSSKTSSSESQLKSVSKKRKASILGPKTTRRAAEASSSKKRKTSTTSQKILNRNSCSGPSSDHIAFVNDNVGLIEDHFSDVLNGNPFAAPRKKIKTEAKTDRGRTKAVTKMEEPPSSASYSPPGKKDRKARKVDPTFKATLDAKHKVDSERLKARRASRKAEDKEKEKTTMVGRPHVEPLAIGPTGKYVRSHNLASASASASASDRLEDFLEPPTEFGSSASSPKNTTRRKKKRGGLSKAELEAKLADSGRGQRSFARTPPPSFMKISSRFASLSTTTVDTKLKRPRQVLPVPIDVAATGRKASYDVGFSEVRAIVPLDTPIHGLQDQGGHNDTDKSTSDTGLDAGQLSDAITMVELIARSSMPTPAMALREHKPRGKLLKESNSSTKETFVSKGEGSKRSASSTREKDKGKEASKID